MRTGRKSGGVVGTVLGLLTGLALLAGCGGDDTPDAGKGTKAPQAPGKTPGTAPAKTTDAPAKTTEATAKKAWADRVFDIYVSAIKETAAALEKEPPAAEALPKLQAIRDKAIEALVPLGREREAMDAAPKAQAESQLRMKVMMDLGNTDAYKAYAKLHDGPYNITKMKTDEEKACQKLLSGMNIITQYAHFELLKKQEPKEAERLGIK